MDATIRQQARTANTARDMIALAPRIARTDHPGALRLLRDAETVLQNECVAMRAEAVASVKATYKGCPACHGTGTINFNGQTRHCPRQTGRLCTPKTRKKAGSVDSLVSAALKTVAPLIRTHRHEVQAFKDEVRSWIQG